MKTHARLLLAILPTLLPTLVPSPLNAAPPAVFEQEVPLLKALARVDDAGLQVDDGRELLELNTVAWGRENALLELDFSVPGESGCAPAQGRLVTLACPMTLERPMLWGVERWALGGVIQQSWTLDAPPPSGRSDLEPLALEVEVRGAELFLNSAGEGELGAGGAGDVVLLVTPEGTQWQYGSLRAWDANGSTLDAWLEIEGDRIRVRVDDTNARYPIEVDPVLTQPSITITNSLAIDFGIDMAFGDVNADARTDLLVGARFGVDNFGQAFLYMGTNTGLSSTPGRVYTSLANYGKFGEYVAMKGNINGDAYEDAVVSEFYEEAIYVYHGSATGLPVVENTKITGVYGLGRMVDIIGDWNNDGFDDVVAGSQDNVAVFYRGSATGLNPTPVTTQAATDPQVTGVGDTNNDNFDEVAFCGYEGGSVSVIRGATTFPGTISTLTVTGMPKLCSAIGRAGDVNGDGYADLIASDKTYSSGAGRAVVFYGSASGLSTSTQIPSPQAGIGFGDTVETAGDVNGDGYDDVIISDDYDHNFVYIYHGSATGIETTPVNTLGIGSTNFGYRMEGGRDINRDGYDDVAIGDFASRTVYIYYGCPDVDKDGFCAPQDCNDNNAAMKPTAQEVCDSVDNDCDGLIDDADSSTSSGSKITWYRDADGDNYGVPTPTVLACAKPSGYASIVGDCNDGVAAINPGAQEVCDTVDNDCDTLIDDADSSTSSGSKSTFFRDADNDTYGASTPTQAACATPPGYANRAGDCNDSTAAVNPGAQEVCDTLDNDCDTQIDDADASTSSASKSTWYRDADNDTYGALTPTQLACAKPTGFVANSTDCNDGNPAINPGAAEICDGLDNDCDTLFDDQDPSVDDSSQATYFRDLDGDGYGTPSPTLESCSRPTGYAVTSDDCNDSSAAINPGAQEVCDTIDNDCDTQIDDADPSTSEASKTTWYGDSDNDTFGASSASLAACVQPSGYVANNTDCNDSSATINPNAQEVCDQVDNDCDTLVDDSDPSTSTQSKTTFYGDGDGDGFGSAASTQAACQTPEGFVSNSGDCNDSSNTINPEAQEICDGIDNDCDTLVDDQDPSVDDSSQPTWYLDADSDGFGALSPTQVSCGQPSGYSATNTDCNDSNAAVNPDASEICDSVDNDCDLLVDTLDPSYDSASAPTWYRDADEDTFGDADDTQDACEQPAGYVADNTDCDDTSDSIHPEAQEICDTIDNDCDTLVDDDDPSTDPDTQSTFYRDSDRDGFGDANDSQDACEAPTGYLTDSSDCDDDEDAINPDAQEICDNADNDCDDLIDDADSSVDDGTQSTWYLDGDGDGYGDASTSQLSCTQPSEYVSDDTDCDDGVASTYPGATEVCDGLDNDCNPATGGDTDTDDDGVLDCESSCSAAGDDLTDSDQDGLLDACDPSPYDGYGPEGSGLTCSMSAGGDGNRSGSFSMLGMALLGLSSLWIRRGRLRRRTSTVAVKALALTSLLVGALLMGGQALAQTAPQINIQQFIPAAGADQPFAQVMGADTPGQLIPSFGLYLNYASMPLAFRSDVEGSEALLMVGQQAQADVLAALGLGSRFELGVGFPVTFFQTGDTLVGGSPLASFALGDLRIQAKAQLLRNDQGPSLALAALATAPTGTPAAYQGHGGPTFEPLVALGWRFSERFQTGLNAGYVVRLQPEVVRSLELGNELRYGLAGRFELSPGTLAVMGELFGRVPLGGTGAGTPLELHASVRYSPAKGHALSLGAGPGLTQGYGTPLWRASLGYTFSGARREPVVAVDTDGDGIVDSADSCPEQPEDVDRFKDEDGCPDPDNDQDGVVDGSDKCVNEAEDRDTFEDADGCPDPDNDKDGLLDAADKCPLEPETRNDFEDGDGCPDVVPAKPAPKMEVKEGEILLFFALDSTELDARSIDLLDKLATFMATDKKVKLKLLGFADATGEDPYNLNLSKRRTQEVLAYLVKKGVAKKRIEIEAYGEGMPRASNDTDSGRAENRRVRVLVLWNGKPMHVLPAPLIVPLPNF